MPPRLIDRLLNVATPLTAGTLNVPPNVPPPEFVPMASTTDDVFPVTTLLKASSIETWTAGLRDTPAVALLGCAVNTRCVTVAGFTVCATVLDWLPPRVESPA